MQKTDTMNWRPRDFEDLARAGAVLGGVCYVLGLIAVNTYLFRLGASEFSVFRPRFVVCGFLVVATLLLGFVSKKGMIEATVRHELRTKDENETASSPEGPMFWVITPLVGMLLIFRLFDVPPIRVSDSVAVPRAILIWVLGVGVAYFLGNLMVATRSKSDAEGHQVAEESAGSVRSDRELLLIPSRSAIMENVHKILQLQEQIDALETKKAEAQRNFDETLSLAREGVVFHGSLVLIAFALFVYQFSVTVMPSIPEQFGGVEPRLAVFAVTEQFSDTATDLGLMGSQNPPFTRQVEVLWESEDGYFVRYDWNNLTHKVRLPKSAVAAAIVE